MTGFALSVEAAGAPLHVAAHSHHPWPDASFEGQKQAWLDAAWLLDRKWDPIFETVIPAAQGNVARVLNLPDRATIAFGPNTHSFVLRLLSCMPAGRPVRVLTTGSEFMSFARQIARLEEDGLVVVERIATEPFATFEERFAAAAARGGHDLVFFSQVYFDSGFAVRDVAKIARAVPDAATFVVIDGYHGFMAVPTDIAAIASRAFYLAGGYKYAMAGEGVCFLHCPPGYGVRPRDTGWYAGFETLEGGSASVSYSDGGARFFGATFDVSGLYRFNAVQDWLAREGWTVPKMLAHVRELERAFLAALDARGLALSSRQLLVPDAAMRGRFLAFRTEAAGEIVAKLREKNVIADSRGDRLRFGFSIYHSENDAVRLVDSLS
jgi:selenocysteine lyase/cysteine desulfurase